MESAERNAHQEKVKTAVSCLIITIIPNQEKDCETFSKLLVGMHEWTGQVVNMVFDILYII